jgi:hypothetical protein
MAKEPKDSKAPRDPRQDDVTQFFKIFIGIVQKQQEQVINNTVSAAALLSAVHEKMPEIAEAYERHLKRAERDSPFAQKGRQIAAELDAIVVRLQKKS